MEANGDAGGSDRGRALVVDDSFVIRKLHKANLERMSFEVMEASGGREAAEVVSKEGLHSIKLMIVDLMMPDMHGADLIKIFRSMDGGDAVKIIVCSSKADAEDVRRVAPLGIAAYIVKPVNPVTFSRKIQELFPV